MRPSRSSAVIQCSACEPPASAMVRVAVLVAVGAVDDVDAVEVADAALRGGLRDVVLGLEHGGPHRQLGHPGVVDQRPRARVVARRQPGQFLAVGALDGHVLAPGERRGRQRDREQRDDRARARWSAAAAGCAAGSRRPASAGAARPAQAQRFLDEPRRQPGQHAGDEQDDGALEEVRRACRPSRPARRSAAASATGTASRPSSRARRTARSPAAGSPRAAARRPPPGAGRPSGWRR